MENPNLSPELNRILKIAACEAERENTGQVQIIHVLSACVMDSLNVGAELFQRQGITLLDLRTLNFDKKPTQP